MALRALPIGALIDTLQDVHALWAWVVVAGNAIAGAWALAAHWHPSLRGRPLWVFTTVIQLTIFVQVVLGVAMVQSEGVEAPEFHLFYGFVMIITVGIVYSYRPQIEQYQYLLYGGGGFFLMGLGFRAIVLA